MRVHHEESGFLVVVRTERAMAGWRAQTVVSGWRAQTPVSGWRAQTAMAGERAQRHLAGRRSQTAMTDHEMYGVENTRQHFVDLREFPEDKLAQHYMSLHKPRHIPFSFETENI